MRRAVAPAVQLAGGRSGSEARARRVSAGQHRPAGIGAPRGRLAGRAHRHPARRGRRGRGARHQASCCSSPSTASRSTAIADFALDPRRRGASARPGARADASRPTSTAPASRSGRRSKARRSTRFRCDRTTTRSRTACCWPARSGPELHPEIALARRRPRQAGLAVCSAGRPWRKPGSARSGCCCTASSTPSPTRSC